MSYYLRFWFISSHRILDQSLTTYLTSKILMHVTKYYIAGFIFEYSFQWFFFSNATVSPLWSSAISHGHSSKESLVDTITRIAVTKVSINQEQKNMILRSCLVRLWISKSSCEKSAVENLM